LVPEGVYAVRNKEIIFPGNGVKGTKMDIAGKLYGTV